MILVMIFTNLGINNQGEGYIGDVCICVAFYSINHPSIADRERGKKGGRKYFNKESSFFITESYSE